MKNKKKKPIIIITIGIAVLLALVILYAILHTSGKITDGEYTIVREHLRMGGGGSSYDEDISCSGTVTVDGLEESGGESGTIVLNCDDEVYTGSLKIGESNSYDVMYDIEWDYDAPEKSENPFGYSEGSTNTESSWLVTADGEIRLKVLWTYSHLLYYSDSSDVYQGEDQYVLEKNK